MFHPVTAGIYPQEDKEQQREAPERRPAIAEEGQRYAYDGSQAEHHADVDEDMKEKYAHHAVAVYAPEGVGLALRKVYEAQYEGKEKQQHHRTAYEALLLAHGAEDEVGVLLRHVLQLRLRAVEEALPLQPARADGYLCLYDIVACSARVVLQPEQHTYAHLLVPLHHLVQHEAGRVVERHAAKREQRNESIGQVAVAQGKVQQPECRGSAGNGHRPYGIIGIYQLCEEYGDGIHAQDDEQARVRLPLSAAVDTDKACRKDLYENHDQHLPQARRLYAPELLVVKADPDHEVDHGRYGREEQAAGHALAVKRQEQSRVDQRSAGLLLQDYQPHGQDYQGCGDDEVIPSPDTEAIAAHDLGQAERDAELRKLGRLDAEGADLYPRHRAVYVTSQERRRKQHAQEEYVYNVGERLDKPVVYHEDKHAQEHRAAYPDYLHPAARGKVQDVGRLLIVIACTADTHPPQRQ